MINDQCKSMRTVAATRRMTITAEQLKCGSRAQASITLLCVSHVSMWSQYWESSSMTSSVLVHLHTHTSLLQTF